MSDKVIVQKGRTNTLIVNLGIDVTGNTFKSEIRTAPDSSSPLIATWTIAITTAATGILTLTLDESVTKLITYDAGYMDLKRINGGKAVPVFDKPIEVDLRSTVTL